jgi:hypothetical protein
MKTLLKYSCFFLLFMLASRFCNIFWPEGLFSIHTEKKKSFWGSAIPEFWGAGFIMKDIIDEILPLV